MLEAVFHHGLKEHARNECLQRVFVDLFHDVKAVFAKAGDFDVEIIVDKR